MKKTFQILTLGCKVNQYESQRLREQLRGRNYRETAGAADICVINTCTVTEKSDRKSKRLIKTALRRGGSRRVVVTGCYAQRKPEEIATLGDRILIAPNEEKKIILGLLEAEETFGSERKSDLDMRDAGAAGSECRLPGITFFQNHNRAFVKVQDGCDHFCSYCIIPHVRGRARSRNPGEVLEEIRRLAAGGIKEVVLTGINLGSFSISGGPGLVDLLGQIEEIEGISRIRLSSIEPAYVSDELLEQMYSSAKLCRHLAVPLQSGDDGILRRMNRHYSGRDYLKLIEKIRSRIPDIALTTDCLVGFPGETGENFNNTLRLVGTVRPARTHIFSYSRRPGTEAAEFDGQVHPAVIKQRYERLRDLAKKLSRDYRRRFIGKVSQVLVETRRDKKTDFLTGYTDTYIRVLFPGNDELMNELVPVKITKVEGNYTFAQRSASGERKTQNFKSF